jgi:hypothetical protein
MRCSCCGTWSAPRSPRAGRLRGCGGTHAGTPPTAPRRGWRRHERGAYWRPDDKEAAATRRATLALVLTAGSATAASALLAGISALAWHHSSRPPLRDVVRAKLPCCICHTANARLVRFQAVTRPPGFGKIFAQNTS